MTSAILLIADDARAAEPAWPLVWTGGDNSGDWGVFTGNSDGSNEVLLPNTENETGNAALSPDGKEVAYENWTPSNNGTYTLALQSLSAPYPQQNIPISNLPVGDAYFRWYPDDRGVVYLGNDGGIYSLRFDDMNGSTPLPHLLVPADQNGQYRWPSVSPDGTKLLYADLLNGQWVILVRNIDGSDPQELTDPSVVSNVEEPNVSPDGSQLTFDGSVSGDAGLNVWVADINSDYTLSNIHRVTTDNGSDQEFPSWASDGNIIYNHYGYSTSADDGVYEVGADGSDNQRLVDTSAGYAEYASEAQPTSRGVFPALAADFRPWLDFDSSEKWRPLNVRMVLNETDPTTGNAWNSICSPSQGCTGLAGLASLQAYPTSDSYLELAQGEGNSPDDYYSPHPECLVRNATNTQGLQDCDTGMASAIYWHVVGPSPGNYTYFDYWFFYRYNQGVIDTDEHEGDWEGMTIAPTQDYSGIAFVELSWHGRWQSYLPGDFTCDDDTASPTSCTTVSGSQTPDLHVVSFPAAGSHSNYPAAGDYDALRDNGNNGEDAWGNNQDPLALVEFPPTAPQGSAWSSGPMQWTDWPGNWGASGSSPCSPAGAPRSDCADDHAEHFFAPWSSNGNLDCQDVCPASASKHQAPLACSDWFGGGVAALACNQGAMRRALRARALTKHGGFAMHVVGGRRRAATAPGLAQLVARALRPGERLVLSGIRSSGTALLVRAQQGNRLVTVTFKRLPTVRGHMTVTVRRGRRYPVLVLTAPGIRMRPSSTLRQTVPQRLGR